MTERFDKFTEQARKTLQLAQAEAQRFNHNYIGTEHVLLGLVREGDGTAARVLRSLGIELDKVRTSVEFIIGRGDRTVMGEIGLTPRAKRVIELAVDEARRLNHHYIGTEHLLLGLVREGEGIAAGVLESLGVSLEKVRAATLVILKAGQTDAGPPAAEPGVPRRFDRFTERSRNVLRLAQEEARRLGSSYIGSEHIFLGILSEGDGVAARVLKDLGVDPDQARAAIEALLNGPEGVQDPGMAAKGEVGLSEDGMHVLERAVEESKRLGHHYVGTEHLLLAVLRESEGKVVDVLESLGHTSDRVRARVIEVLKDSSGYRIGGPDRPGFGSMRYRAGAEWTMPYGFDLQLGEPPDLSNVEVSRGLRGLGFRPGALIELSDEAFALGEWVKSELDFAILKHVDNSFLALLRDAMSISLLLNRSFIGAEHLLAAMLRDENSAASRLLGQHGADLDAFYRALEGGTGKDWEPPFTYEAMRAIYLAITEARAAGTKATAEHLLLGIMLEGTSSAYVALAGAGITADEVRALLSGGPSDSE